nr:RING/U-box superfamily protein [Tanacetum cinerariifolium]
MSPGNICHRGTEYLTEKYVGPTFSLGIVTGEGIPVEHSPANIPQRQVTGETFLRRQVAGGIPEMSLGNVVNVVVNLILAGRCSSLNMKLGILGYSFICLFRL